MAESRWCEANGRYTCGSWEGLFVFYCLMHCMGLGLLGVFFGRRVGVVEVHWFAMLCCVMFWARQGWE